VANQENWIAGFRTIDDGRTSVANYVWDTGTLAWVPQSGGGAGPTADVNIISSVSLAVTGPLTDTQLRAAVVPTTDDHTTAALPLSVRLSDGAAFYNATGGGGGNLATAAKGTTAAGNPTSENTDVNTQSLHTRITNASIAVTGTFWQATQPVSGTFWQATQPVSGPLTDTQLRATPVPVSGSVSITGSVVVTGPLTDTQLRATPVPISGTVAATQSGAWSTGRTWALDVAVDDVKAQLFDGTNNVTIKALNNQVVAADFGLVVNAVIHGLTSAGGGGYVDVKVTPSGALITASNAASTNTRSSIAGAAVDTLILATNTSRLGATVFNDSTAILYLSLGTAAASTTDFTLKMSAASYYEVPFGYTGQIRGIWASATGSARVGELT
jgi:hypothetical protein